MKREREWDSPSSSNASQQSSSSISQNETPPRAIAGSRRVHKELSFINQTQQVHTHPPQHQQSQAAPSPSTMSQSHISLPPSQQAPSRRRSHSPIQPNESEQTTSTISPFNNTDLNVFALPVDSNDLGRLPLHGQMTFSAQAHPSQPQTHPPQRDPEIRYWYTASQPTSYVDASETSSSYGPYYPPAPAPQQPYPHHHAQQGISGGEFPSASEASSAVQRPYGMDAALFDNMGERAKYTQQRTSTYGLETMHSSFPGMASGSMVSTLQSSSDSSVEDVYRGMGMETMPAGSASGHYQHQHQTTPLQQEQGVPSYPCVLDNDAVAVWSNAPTGFECGIFVLFSRGNLVYSSSSFAIRLNEWSTFLSNFGELTQDNVQDHSGGQYQHQHQHQAVPQQREQQPLSYPLIIDSDIRSNAPTGPSALFLSSFVV